MCVFVCEGEGHPNKKGGGAPTKDPKINKRGGGGGGGGYYLELESKHPKGLIGRATFETA